MFVSVTGNVSRTKHAIVRFLLSEPRPGPTTPFTSAFPKALVKPQQILDISTPGLIHCSA